MLVAPVCHIDICKNCGSLVIIADTAVVRTSPVAGCIRIFHTYSIVLVFGKSVILLNISPVDIAERAMDIAVLFDVYLVIFLIDFSINLFMAFWTK